MATERTVFPADRRIAYTNYARTALEKIIQIEGLDGTAVLTPAFNCHGTFDPLFEKYDITPVFVDVELPSMLPDREAVSARADEADAVLLLHAFGLPAKMNFWVDFTREYGLLLVEDCARALGATYDGEVVGSFGDAAFYSLMKVSPAMKGGAVVTNNGEANLDLPSPSREVSYYAPAVFGARNEIPPALSMRALDGLNRHLFQSFVEDQFDRMTREHRRMADRLRAELGDLIEFQPHREGRSYFWLSGTFRGDREALFEYLDTRDVPIYRVWDEPWAEQRNPDSFEHRFPNSHTLARHVLHFPIRELDPDAIEEVVRIVREFCDKRL
jgi:dTDP-4-amino-4,6-dideoxygalactose transaminase